MEKRLPRNYIPTLAKRGMIVMQRGTGHYAVIVDVPPDYAIIEYENGKREMATWGEMSIEAVAPDPAEFTRGTPRKPA